MASAPSFPLSPDVSVVRAWLSLVWFSIARQARMRQMVWIAVGLMLAAVFVVGMNTYRGRWTLTDRPARPLRISYRDATNWMYGLDVVLGRAPGSQIMYDGFLAGTRVVVDQSAFVVFSRWVVFAIFQSFLLPLWTLSFAVDALGNERESRTILWLLSRPLPRWSIYLGKWVAALPWCLGLNLLGFSAICLAGGAPGLQALECFWPAVIWGTLAFSALFHLIAAAVRRPAVVGLIYSFFFETLVGDLPGDLKRLSLSFYIRSQMYNTVSELGLEPEALSVYSPVEPWVARAVLVGATVLLTGIGICVFSRTEYGEDV